MKYKWIFLLLTFFCTKLVLCQQKFTYLKSKPIFEKNNLLKKPPILKPNAYSLAAAMLIQPNYYSSHLGFFCKQEIKLQKAIKLPFVFRLGSVQAVDYLEGKRNANISFR